MLWEEFSKNPGISMLTVLRLMRVKWLGKASH